jgi:hypothetical protein
MLLCLLFFLFKSSNNYPCLKPDEPICDELKILPHFRVVFSTECLNRNYSYNIRPSWPAGVSFQFIVNF